MSNPTAKIPTENVPQLRNKIEKLNKVATKLELPPISLRVGEPEVQQVDQGIVMLTGPHATNQSAMYQEVVPVWVEGEAPRVNGWEFIATLEHDENGTLIRRIPNFADEVDLSQYRTATPDNCDHCGYKRRRNDTYIVVNVTGETKQVGSNCLKDFTGHENPQAIARFLEQVRELIESVSGGGYSEGRFIPRYDLVELMATAVMEIREHGYVSRRIAEETGQTATADRVRFEFFTRIQPRPAANDIGGYDVPTEADYAQAAKVVEWIRSLDEDALQSDYLYNLFTVCKSGTLTDRQFGIAASGPLPYERAHPEARNGGRKAHTDEFLGEVKDRIDVTFTVEREFDASGEYGPASKYFMRTDTGHKLSWRTGTYTLEVGKTYKADFSVAKHWEGRNGKETQVNRPKGAPQEVQN